MHRANALCWLACGCLARPHAAAVADATGGGDDAVNVPDDIMRVTCVGTQLAICPSPLPTMPLTFGDMTIDTSDPMCQYIGQSTGGPVCAIGASDLTITGNLRITGTFPIVLYAMHDLTVMSSATIDVASHHGQAARPAGAAVTPCSTGLNGSTAGAGGAGGTLGTAGGDGGSGGTGGNGGIAFAQVFDGSFLRGGCPGGLGHSGSAPGSGGGAVYLVAGNHLEIDGIVDASGGGAGAPPTSGATYGGADGGGSGGMIELDAPIVDVAMSAVVIALGGGGAGGNGTSTFGGPGDDPIAVAPIAPANGGSGGVAADGGGAGSPPSSGVGAAGGNGGVNGGGGGGGGAGIVRIYAQSQTRAGAIAPPAPPSP